MESCIDDIRNWILNDKLKLNDDKTEFLMIGTSQQLAKSNYFQSPCWHLSNYSYVICEELELMVRCKTHNGNSHNKNMQLCLLLLIQSEEDKKVPV